MPVRDLRSKAHAFLRLLIAVLWAYVVTLLGPVFATAGASLTGEAFWGYICAEFGTALLALIGIVVLGGKALLRPSMDRARIAWVAGAWALFIAVLTSVGDIEVFTGEGAIPIAPDWPYTTLCCALFCLGVGFSEEFIYRGLLLGGLLQCFGTTSRGVWGAVIASSLVFGMAHLYPFDITNLRDPVLLVDAIQRVFVPATFGFVAAAVVVKTHRVFWMALVHALYDFILYLSWMGIAGHLDLEGSYEVLSLTAEELAGEVLLALIWIPAVIVGVRLLRSAAHQEITTIY